MAPAALAGVLTASLLAVVLSSGCGRDTRSPAGVDVSWSITKSPSTISNTIATVALRDRSRQPVSGAHLQLVAQMSHPGMSPIVVPLVERAAGTYDAALQFSMAGDWILMATGELSDGSRVSSELEVPGVTGSR